jgi:DNA polymerase-3 subunit beta
MKLTVNKDVLLEGLQHVQSIVGMRTTLPILYNVYLKAEKDRLTLTTTDLEVSVRTSVEAKIARAGGTTLPARRVFSIFRELPTPEIEIEVDDKDLAVIKSGTSLFKINGLSEDEFPPLPKFQGGKSYVLDQKMLKEMLTMTHYAASNDESRYILNGVHFSFRDGKLTMVATDGRRMAHYEQEAEFLKEAEGEWTVPNKAVVELLKTIGDEGTAKIQVTENQVAFEYGTILLISKLLEGTYPNFKQVLPQSSENRERIAVPSREDFLNAIRRVALLVNDKSNSVTLTFGKDRVVILASSPEIGEAKEDVAVKYRGKEITVAFNPDFISDPLKNLKGPEFAFELGDELSPGLIKTDTPFLYVLMPMRVK